MKLKTIDKYRGVKFNEVIHATVNTNNIYVRTPDSEDMTLMKGAFDLIELDGEILHENKEYRWRGPLLPKENK